MHKQIVYLLNAIGVLSKNINQSTVCTFESNLCHSFRRDGLAAGRMYAFMGFKKWI